MLIKKGLNLFLTETYFELDAYETKEISTQGLETETNSKYEAYFEVESVGNGNISANIILDIKGITDSKSDSDDIASSTTIIVIIGALILGTFLVYSRRIQ